MGYTKIEFAGHSDDLVDVTRTVFSDQEGPGTERKETEYAVSPKHSYAGMFGVKVEASLFKVHVIYDGCWSFSVGPWDEGCSFPSVEITHIKNHEYSWGLQIITDDVQARVFWLED